MQASSVITPDKLTDAEKTFVSRYSTTLPNKKEMEASLSIDRTTLKPTGRFASLVWGLRNEDLKTYGYEWLKYVPNSRYMWMHGLLPAVKSRSISRPDVIYAQGFWMPDKFHTMMLADLETATDTAKTGFTIAPSVNMAKSKMVPIAREKEVFYTLLSNPGILNLNISKSALTSLRNLPPDLYQEINNGIHNLVLDWKAKGEEEEAKRFGLEDVSVLNDLIKMAYENREMDDDPQLMMTMQKMRHELLQPRVKMTHLYALAHEMDRYYHLSREGYIASLLSPFETYGGRIPSSVPIPTSAFKMRQNITLVTNASGNVAGAWTPFYLSNGIASTLGINNNAGLNGSASNANFLAVDIGQSTSIYDSYRLVSAGVRLMPIASALNSSGYMTISTQYATENGYAAIGSAILPYSKFGQFSITENGSMVTTSALSQSKSMFHRYIPKDDSYFDYLVTADAECMPTCISFFVSGAGASMPVVRLELVANFEATVAPTYTDFIPTAVSEESMDDIVIARKRAQASQGIEVTPKETIGKESMVVPMDKATTNSLWSTLLDKAVEVAPAAVSWLSKLIM